MRADGSELRKLTDNELDDVHPSWEPNGERIVFAREFSSVNSDLIVMDSEGGSSRRLRLSEWPETDPEWSSNGKWIAFAWGGSITDGGDIQVVRPSGRDVRIIASTNQNSINRSPSFAPHAFEVVHVEEYEAPVIYIAACCRPKYEKYDVDSESQRPAYLDWSDSGDYIGYSEDIGNGLHDLYAVSWGGTKEWLIHSELEDALFGDWVHGDRGVLFAGRRDHGRYDLYLVRTDGSNLERQTNHAASEIDPDWIDDLPRCLGQPATIVGTESHDHLTGTPGPDVIAGLGEDDEIRGLGGNDIICGGRGTEFIEAGAGDDRIYGGRGSDLCGGGAERECGLMGRTGDDWIKGGLGGDRMNGGWGHDVIIGGRGDDYARGDSGNDVIRMGPGRDGPEGGAGSDAIFGGPGNDWMHGASGNDVVHGGRGTDEIDGEGGYDSCRNTERAYNCESPD